MIFESNAVCGCTPTFLNSMPATTPCESSVQTMECHCEYILYCRMFSKKRKRNFPTIVSFFLHRQDMGLPEDWHTSTIVNWWSQDLLSLPTVANPAKNYKKKCPELPILPTYKNSAPDTFWDVFPSNFSEQYQLCSTAFFL